jgi:hypothetical protein
MATQVSAKTQAANPTKYTTSQVSPALAGGTMAQKTVSPTTPTPVQSNMPVSADSAARGVVGYGAGGAALYNQGASPANVIGTQKPVTTASPITISNKNKDNQISEMNNTLAGYAANRGMTSDGETMRYPDGSVYQEPQKVKESDIENAYKSSPEFQLLEQMRQSLDANTASQIAGIQQQLEQRRMETNEFSQNQSRAAERSRLMTGQSQAAPTSVGSLMNAQEKYRVKQIAALDTEEQRLISAAKEAQQSGNYQLLAKHIGVIQGIREQKQKEVAEVNKSIAEQNKKLQEQAYIADRENSIADLYSSGITNVADIMSTLKDSGVNITSKEVKDTLANLVPVGLQDMIDNARERGASPKLVSDAMMSGDVNKAHEILGSYAAKAPTGIASEYEYYRRDAESRGLVPVDFNTYQNQDANRKKSIAKAGVSGGGSGTGGFTPSGGTGANAVTDSLFNIVRVNSNSATLPILESSYKNAKTTGEKLDVIAVAAKIPAAQKQDITAVKNAMNNVDRAIAELDNGAKTGLINSKAQYAANAFGKDYDPALQKVGSYITAAIQPYRNEVTGAAWGGQEDGEYQNLFGSTKYSPTELKARLSTLKEILASKAANTISTNIAPAGDYSQMFSQTFTNLPNPTQTTGQSLIKEQESASKVVDDFYQKASPKVQDVVDSLVQSGKDDTKIVAYLKFKGYIK